MPKSVFALLDDLAENVANLKTALAPLASFTTGTGRMPKTAPARRRRRRAKRATTKTSVKRKTATPKVRRKTSPALHAKRVQQGKYLGAIRPLSKANRAKVKAVQAKAGYDAAIKLAQSLKK